MAAMRKLPSLWSISALVALAAPASQALAQAEATSPLAAIQQRVFAMDHEIELAVGWLPLDPFTKTLSGEASYTYHFSDQVAWEVVRGFYGYSIQTGLRRQAEVDFGVPGSAFEEYRFGVSSSIEIAPAYGKFSLLNDSVAHAELLLAVGPMVAWFNNGGIKVGPIGGIGARLFANDTISIRFDARYGYLIGKASGPICTLSLGVSFDFGHAD